MTKKKRRRQHEQQRHEPTRHQINRQQQQQKRQRIFLIVGIAVVSAVGGILGGGWYQDEYLPLRETVISVNGTDFTMGYYVDVLKAQNEVYQQIYGTEQASLFLQSLPDQVAEFIQQNELMMQAAAGMGFTISDAEVAGALKESEPPLGKEYRELMRHDLLVQRLLDEHFEQEVPQSGEQRHVMAMFLESESQAVSTRAKLVAGEDFATLAGELSLEKLSPEGSGDFDWHPKGILSEGYGLSLVEEYAFSVAAGTLSQPLYDEERTKSVGYWLAELMEKDEDATGELYHIRVMLLGSEEEAQEIRARLVEGEDFATLAEEYSQHEASREAGGDMDWLGEDDIQPVLEDFVLNAEVGDLSEAVKDEASSTTGGYWLVKVVAVEADRQISDDDRDYMKTKALSDWISSLWDDPNNKVESYLTDEQKAWALAKATGG
ncbi:MAG: peptidylprolyl isomerase [Dehalococcoidales bacterium]|nr:peptidylprolyl isomerase [Dehalococcoidales bacterium]